MGSPAVRPRMTLSEQLSHGRRAGTLTLATILEAEKNRTATTAAVGTAAGRTLLDIIQEEEESLSSSWRELRDRIRIRPVAAETVRSAPEPEPASGSESGTVRVSLMTLMEMREWEEEEGEGGAAVMALGEMDGGANVAVVEDEAEEEEEPELEQEEAKTAGGRGGEREMERHVCCVCMVRKKGAAFIPCGHTFCRVCGRELFVGRGNCPLCNVSIAEVLNIF